MRSKLKLCTDCIFYRYEYYQHKQLCEKDITFTHSLVDGFPITHGETYSCNQQRGGTSIDDCGFEGKHFEKRLSTLGKTLKFLRRWLGWFLGGEEQ